MAEMLYIHLNSWLSWATLQPLITCCSHSWLFASLYSQSSASLPSTPLTVVRWSNVLHAFQSPSSCSRDFHLLGKMEVWAEFCFEVPQNAGLKEEGSETIVHDQIRGAETYSICCLTLSAMVAQCFVSTSTWKRNMKRD